MMNIEPEIMARLERASKEDGRSVDEIVNALLADYLNRHDLQHGHPISFRAFRRRSIAAFTPFDWLHEVLGWNWSENEYYEPAEILSNHFDDFPHNRFTMKQAHEIIVNDPAMDYAWTLDNTKALVSAMHVTGFLTKDGQRYGRSAFGLKYVRPSIRKKMVDTVNPFNVPR